MAKYRIWKIPQIRCTPKSIHHTCELTPARELCIVKELAVGAGVVCELSVARGFGEDTGVADTGNKPGEETVFPNPEDFRAFYIK